MQSMMKFPCVFFILFFFLLLLFSNESGATRSGPMDYWETMMKGQPMPEILNGLIDEEMVDSSSEKTKFWSHFNRDFDATSNVIIYLPHGKMHKHEELELPDHQDLKT